MSDERAQPRWYDGLLDEAVHPPNNRLANGRYPLYMHPWIINHLNEQGYDEDFASEVLAQHGFPSPVTYVPTIGTTAFLEALESEAKE